MRERDWQTDFLPMRRLIRRIVLLLVALILTIGGFFTWIEARAARTVMREAMETEARMLAASLDTDRIARLTGTEADLSSPDYHYLRDKLIRIRETNPKYRYLYFFGKRNDSPPFFFMGTAPEDSADYSPPGHVYYEESPTLNRVFEIRDTQISPPFTDRWGTWISALVPIIHSQNGDFLAVFGMDRDASDWQSEILRRSFIPVVITILTVILLSIGALVLRRRQLYDHIALLQQTEEALQVSQRLLRDILDTVPVRVFWKDLDLRYGGCNVPFAKDTGHQSPDDLVGKSDYDFPGSLDTEIGSTDDPVKKSGLKQRWLQQADLYRRDDKWVIENGIAKLGYEEMQTTPEGKCIWLRTSKIPMRDANNQIVGVLGTYEDITESKRAEEALRESESVLRSLFSATLTGVVLLKDRIFHRVNTAFCNIMGYSETELLGQATRILYPTEEEFIRVGNALYGQLERERLGMIETQLRRKNGTLIDVLLCLSPFDPSDLSAGTCATVLDITERKRSEKELVESKEYLQSIFRVAPTGIGVVVNRIIIQVNERLCEMIGYSSQELIDQSARILYPTQEDYDFVGSEKYRQIRADGTGVVETRWQHKDGTIIDVLLASTPIHPSDLSKGVTFTALDITERKRAEEALRESEERYRNFVANASEGIYRIDFTKPIRIDQPHEALEREIADYAVIGEVNSALAAMYNLNPDGMVGRFVRDFAPNCGTQMADLLQAPGYQIADREEIEQTADGTPVYIMESYTGVVEGEILLRVWGVQRNITERKKEEEERKKLEAQLVQAQKMESVGRLAGGIAHDFNNMLGVILGHAELALDQTGSESPFYASLMEIEKAARRSADITRQLLAFARKQTVTPKVLNLNEAIEGMLKMLRRLIGEDIHLVWLPGSDLWPLQIDPAQIDQMLANLCVNARDAIQGVGKVSIETANAVFEENYGAVTADFIPGDYVMLAVSDNGCGMSMEIQEKIFEPFFTTKGVGEGTGLGLAMVYGVVRQNNGFINVYSEPGKGTTFRIYLPRFEGETLQTKEIHGEEYLTGHGETILLVEDEPMVLNLGKTLLETLGYRVLAAGTPGEAMRLAENHAGEIHLLVTDVIMPEMNGRDLAQRLHSLYPNLRQLFMSGYTASVIAHHNVLNEGVVFLQKPFQMKILSAKVREALERP